MKFIGYYSKEAVDQYLNYFKKNIDKVEDTRQDIIRPYVSVTSVYNILHMTVNQFNTNMFNRLPTTGQDTAAHL